MQNITLLPAKHRRQTTYQQILNGIGIVFLIILAVIVMPLLLPGFLLNWVGNKLTRCRRCGRFGGLQCFHPAKDGPSFYLCVGCKARYTVYGKNWRDASDAKYDIYFGKHQDVRALLRATTRPKESGAELIRPALSIVGETPSEQLVRPAGGAE